MGVRSLKEGTLILLAIALPQAAAQAQADPTLDLRACESCFYGSLEPVFIHRVNSESDIPVLTRNAPGAPLGQPGDDELIEDTGSFHFEWEPGLRGTLGRQFSPAVGVELRGLFIRRFDDTLRFEEPGGLTLPFEAPFPGIEESDFSNADRAQIRARSRIYSIELDAHYYLTENVRLVAGARHISLDEDLRITTAKGENESAYRIDVDNDLFGGQFGLESRIPIGMRWAVGLGLRAGIYQNSADQKQVIRDRNSTLLLRNARASQSQPAFSVDGGISVSYAFSSWIVATVGYEVLTLSGVAAAAEQVNFQTDDLFPAGGDPAMPVDKFKLQKQDGFVHYNGARLRLVIKLY